MHTKRAVDWKKLGAALLKPSDISGDISKSWAIDIPEAAPLTLKPGVRTPAPAPQTAIPSTPKLDKRKTYWNLGAPAPNENEDMPLKKTPGQIRRGIEYLKPPRSRRDFQKEFDFRREFNLND